MCDKHQHAKLETWVTPINSQHLSSKLVTLFPGESIHEHTTGPGREEVLVILYGAVTVRQGNTERRYVSGETCFIPANTLHAVRNDDDDPGQYCYVVTKKPQPQPTHATKRSILLSLIDALKGTPRYAMRHS